MDDLLNEEDFLPKNYNPKSWFSIFYATGIVLSAICFWGTRLLNDYLNENASIAIVITGLCIPLLLSLLMIFLKRENILYLKVKKAAYAIAALTLSCGCSMFSLMIGATIADHKNPADIPIFFGIITLIYVGIYLVTIAIIIPILKRAQKINRTLPQ